MCYSDIFFNFLNRKNVSERIIQIPLYENRCIGVIEQPNMNSLYSNTYDYLSKYLYYFLIIYNIFIININNLFLVFPANSQANRQISIELNVYPIDKRKMLCFIFGILLFIMAKPLSKSVSIYYI